MTSLRYTSLLTSSKSRLQWLQWLQWAHNLVSDGDVASASGVGVAAAVTEVLAVLALRGPFGQFLRWLRLFSDGVQI